MEIAILQHVDFEGPAEIENWCRQTGNEYKVYPPISGGSFAESGENGFPCDIGRSHERPG